MERVGFTSFERRNEGAPETSALIPGDRQRYLGEITDAIAKRSLLIDEQATIAGRIDGLQRAMKELGDGAPESAPLRERRDALAKTLVPEARVGGKLVYDIVMADSVTSARAPLLRNLF